MTSRPNPPATPAPEWPARSLPRVDLAFWHSPCYAAPSNIANSAVRSWSTACPTTAIPRSAQSARTATRFTTKTLSMWWGPYPTGATKFCCASAIFCSSAVETAAKLRKKGVSLRFKTAIFCFFYYNKIKNGNFLPGELGEYDDENINSVRSKALNLVKEITKEIDDNSILKFFQIIICISKKCENSTSKK